MVSYQNREIQLPDDELTEEREFQLPDGELSEERDPAAWWWVNRTEREPAARWWVTGIQGSCSLVIFSISQVSAYTRGKNQHLVNCTSCYFVWPVLNNNKTKRTERVHGTCFCCVCVCVCLCVYVCVWCVYACMCVLDGERNKVVASRAPAVI